MMTKPKARIALAITLTLLIGALFALQGCNPPAPQPLPRPRSYECIGDKDVFCTPVAPYREWTDTPSPSARVATAARSPYTGNDYTFTNTMPVPWEQDVFPKTYGIDISNVPGAGSPYVSTTDLDLLARHDIAEMQLEFMLAERGKAANGAIIPIVDGSQTAFDYIDSKATQYGTNTKIGVYTNFSYPDLALRRNWTAPHTYNPTPVWFTGGSAPTATPVNVPTTQPSYNTDDTYWFRRQQAYVMNNLSTSVADSSTCGSASLWLCETTDIPIWREQGSGLSSGNYLVAAANTYNGVGAHTHNGETYADWNATTIGNLWTQADFVRDDLAFPQRWAYIGAGVQPDANYDDISDYTARGNSSTEAGKKGADLFRYYGLLDLYQQLRQQGIPVWGNGAWAPEKITAAGTPVAPDYIAQEAVDGAMMELTYNTGTGKLQMYFKNWANENNACGWACQQKIAYDWAAAGKNLVILGGSDGLNVPVVTARYGSIAGAFDFAFASALLTNAYFSWQPTISEAAWNADYWVSYDASSQRCLTTTDPAGKHWLGTPTTTAQLQGGTPMSDYLASGTTWSTVNQSAWLRKFDRGLTLVNPTENSVTFTLPAGTWKEIDGVTALGATYRLSPSAGVVLCNITAMSGASTVTPTPANIPIPTLNPTPNTSSAILLPANPYLFIDDYLIDTSASADVTTTPTPFGALRTTADDRPQTIGSVTVFVVFGRRAIPL